MRPRWLNESTHAEKQPHVHPRERLADQPLSRIFHTFERRVRARSLQQSRALVGRVPSRGALLAFPAECETAQPWPALIGALPLPHPTIQPTRPPPPATRAGIPRPQTPAPLHRFLKRLPEGFQNQPPTIVTLENVLPPVAPVHHVIDCSRIPHSELPGHLALIMPATLICQSSDGCRLTYYVPDPFLFVSAFSCTATTQLSSLSFLQW